MTNRFTVALLQHRLLHYRTRLFELLRERCSDRGIDLVVIHGQPSINEQLKQDEGFLPWTTKIRNYHFQLAGKELLWQSLPKELNTCDLVVIMQENKILSNYPILLSRFWRIRKVAYWGHGKNFQSTSPTGMRERWKNLLLKRVDWWFGYTKATQEILICGGFPSNKVTCLNNAIDTSGFMADLAAIRKEDARQELHRLGLTLGDVGLFCGSLYPDKRLDILFEACEKIHERRPNFGLIIIGDGPSMSFVESAAKSRAWVKVLGAKKSRDKALAYSIATVILNPGAVGLHIVDSFCAGVPMVTTLTARHGPEIAYLDNGINGIATSENPLDYAHAVLELLNDFNLHSSLAQACKKDAERYSLNCMVDNFVNGIEMCLQLKKNEAIDA